MIEIASFVCNFRRTYSRSHKSGALIARLLTVKGGGGGSRKNKCNNRVGKCARSTSMRSRSFAQNFNVELVCRSGEFHEDSSATRESMR